MSLREALLAKREERTITLTPSFLTKPVEVILMSVATRRDLIKGAKDTAGEQDAARYEAIIVIETCRDPETKEMCFTRADLDTLIGWPACDLDELAEPALRLNGLLLGGYEDARKNSTPTPS